MNPFVNSFDSLPEDPREIKECLDGTKLYGDDFSSGQIAAWFSEEKEATTVIRGAKWKYPYHALNIFHGYEKLPDQRFSNVLSLGGGDGSEFLPLIERLGKITILEPSENLQPVVRANFIVPSVDGSIPFPDDTFDLVTVFSVLHHVPNVSAVIKELYRCTSPSGSLLLREPIISMGDWRKPRVGLSKHERGIPLHLLRRFIRTAGFRIVSESKCCFTPILFLNRKFHTDAYNSQLVVILDWIISKFPFWPRKYHGETFLSKIRPTGVFYVLRK